FEMQITELHEATAGIWIQIEACNPEPVRLRKPCIQSRSRRNCAETDLQKLPTTEFSSFHPFDLKPFHRSALVWKRQKPHQTLAALCQMSTASSAGDVFARQITGIDRAAL